MEDVAKNRCGVLMFTKTNNETSGGVEYHLPTGPFTENMASGPPAVEESTLFCSVH